MLYKKIKDDRVEARKSKNADLNNLLTTVLGQVQNNVMGVVSKEDLEEDRVPDAEVIKVLNYFVKNAKKGYDITKQESYLNEIQTLEQYLPKLISEDILKETITQIINETKGKLIFGLIFKQLVSKLDGEFDKKLASNLVNQLLKEQV